MATIAEMFVEIGADASQFERETRQVQAGMRETQSEMRAMAQTMGSSSSEMANDWRYMSEEMKNEMRAVKESLRPLQMEQQRVEHEFRRMGMASAEFQGTSADMIRQATELGAAHKKASDALINGNRMAMGSMLQQIGYMNNMTSVASRIEQNYTRMGNPLLTVNNGLLRAVDSMNRFAMSGSAAQLAIEALGPGASMKDLNNMMRQINTQVMNFPIVFALAAAGAALFYGSLHGKVMEENTKYAAAFNNMMEKLSKAFQPLRDAFAAVMIPVYNFIAGIAELIIKFNEAHPTMAKFLQGILLLLPALLVILSPLAIGIGYFAGLRAIMFSLAPIFTPIAAGFAAMGGTALVVAAAIAGVVVAFTYFYKSSETFRNAVNAGIQACLAFGKALVALGKYLFFTAVDGDYLNDWITHLPEPFQAAAQAVGQSVANIRAAIVGTFPAITGFGQNLLTVVQYLWHVMNTGEVVNGWLNGMPAIWQSAMTLIGTAVATMRDIMQQAFAAILAACKGNFEPMIQLFTTLLPNIIAIILGGVPGLVLSIATMFIRMNEGAATGGATLVTKFGEIATNIINTFVNFIATQLPTIVAKGVEILTSLVTGVTNTLPKLVEAGAQIMTTLVNGIVTLLPTILNTGIQLLVTLVNAVLGALPKLIDAATKIIDTLVSGITKMLPQIITMGIKIITVLVENLLKMLPKILDAGIKILMSLIDGIMQILPNLINAAIKLIEAIIKTLASNLPKIIDAGVKILMALIDGIIKILPQLIETAIKLIQQIVQALIQNLPKIIESGVKILNALIDGILKILPQLIQTAISLIMKIVQALIQNLPQIIQAGLQILQALIKGIIQILPQLISTAIKLIMEIARAIISNLPQILSAGAQILRMLIQGILSLVGNLLSTITNNVLGGIGRTISGFGNTMYNAGKGLIDMMVRGIKNMASKVTGAISDIAQKARDFLPFSPAKVGPLSDLDHLDFGGPIMDSLKRGEPMIQRKMAEMLAMPDIVPPPNLTSGDLGTYSMNQLANLRSDQTIYVDIDGRTVTRAVLPHMEREVRLKTGMSFS